MSPDLRHEDAFALTVEGVSDSQKFEVVLVCSVQTSQMTRDPKGCLNFKELGVQSSMYRKTRLSRIGIDRIVIAWFFQQRFSYGFG